VRAWLSFYWTKQAQSSLLLLFPLPFPFCVVCRVLRTRWTRCISKVSMSDLPTFMLYCQICSWNTISGHSYAIISSTQCRAEDILQLCTRRLLLTHAVTNKQMFRMFHRCLTCCSFVMVYQVTGLPLLISCYERSKAISLRTSAPSVYVRVDLTKRVTPPVCLEGFLIRCTTGRSLSGVNTDLPRDMT
jgi:hypothetical protein